LRQDPQRASSPLRGFRGPSVPPVCRGAADARELCELSQHPPGQHQDRLESR
jgi:hypothetical protein